jgi:hypothetical protein
MRTILAAPALTLALLAAPAAATQAQLLTFEGLANEAPVGSYYGSLGISFTANAFALIQSNAGGAGNFGGAPTPPTAIVFSDLPGAPAYMNVTGGFTTGFSLFYSAPAVPGTIRIFSGLDATGTLLATLMLPVTPNGSVAGCPSNPGATFCPFMAAGVGFAGTARSVDFGGTLNDVVFDNVTLGRATAAVVPEPTTVVLLGAGLVGLAGVQLRRRRAMRHDG